MALTSTPRLEPFGTAPPDPAVDHFKQAIALLKEAAARPPGLPAAVPSRLISDCHFAVQLSHFIPNSRTYSVLLFLKRQCERTLGAQRARARERGLRAPRRQGGLNPVTSLLTDH